MILRVEAIDTYYGLVHMLHGVSLEIAPGEVLALLGRNGAGKTTVLKSVMGLVPPRAGRILHRGEDITGLPPHVVARRGIAYVPAGPRDLLDPHRAGEPRHRPAGRRGGNTRRRLPPLPEARWRRAPARPLPLGRRAADARHRPRHHDRAVA